MATTAPKKRTVDESESGPEPPATMPRIETDPVDAAIAKAQTDYPLGPERLASIQKAACKLPPVPKAKMSGATVTFGTDDWLKVPGIGKDVTLWGPSPDYSDSPGAKNVAKAKIDVDDEFASWFMALWMAIVDAIVAGGGGPNASKKVKSKLDAAKSQDEKRTIVTEAHKLHCPLKDGILTTKIKLIADGEPGQADAEAVKSFPPLTAEEFKRGGFQVVAKPMTALDGKTRIPLYRVLEQVQGRPVFVGQVRFELAIKSSITPDGGKRVCVLPMSTDLQLLSMKPNEGGSGEDMPNLADI
jgi:hypothetical protein